MHGSSDVDSSIPVALIHELQQIIGAEGVLTAYSDRMVYECDGFTIEKNCPDVVVFPTDTQQIAAVIKACNHYQVPFLPRGAGTSLAGGTLPIGGGVMLVLTRMKEIEEINLRDRYAIVQPGVVNIRLTQALKGTGYHYAPDPSSQGACTIGGNVANASPIGDMPPLLLALNAILHLDNGESVRMIPISTFFTGYRETMLAKDEWISAIEKT